MSKHPKTSLLPYSRADERGGAATDVWARAVSTGSLALNVALGTGGWPRGSIVELFRPAGGGKTTLLLEAIARAQRHGSSASRRGCVLDGRKRRRRGLTFRNLVVFGESSLPP